MTASNKHEDISNLITPFLEEFNIPAIGAAVIVNNELTAIGATGICRAGGLEKVSISNKWHIGSCGKAITATLLGKLYEENKVLWDESVGRFFRSNIESVIHEGWDEATLDQLLTHSAGVEGDLTSDSLWQPPWTSDKQVTQARIELAKAVLAKPPVHKPGTVYAYSNKGYVLAGLMAELVMKQPFENLIRDMVFSPLGMDAGFGAPQPDDPWGHINNLPIDPTSEMADTPESASPAGRVNTTLEDWSKFIIAHLKGEDTSGGFLKSDTFRLLHTPGTGSGESYAPGWLVCEREWARGRGGSGKCLNHFGSNNRSSALAWLAPEIGFAVLTTANIRRDSTPIALDKLTGTLINKFVGN